MSCRLVACFDIARIGGFACDVVESTGGTFTLEMDDGTYCHEDASGYAMSADYTAFAAALKAALEAQNGSARTYTITYNTGTGKYTIAIDNGTVSLTFSTQAERGTNLRQAIGMTGDRSGSQSYTSQAKCFYVIHTEYDGLREYSDDYEDIGGSHVSRSTNGKIYGVTTTGRQMLSDWVIPLEPHAATFERSAASAVPWTWQHFFAHCRVIVPFLMVYDTETSCHQLREDGDAFKPRRVQEDYNDWWDIDFRTFVDRASA